MKGSILLISISISLLLLLPHVAGVTPVVTCPYGSNPIPVPVETTYWPPGPYGSIYVESSPPGAVVYLNGDNHGHAPVTISGLWPGTYTISAVLPGFERFTSVTTISGPTLSAVYCPLVPDTTGNGLYIMSSPPGADVYLDGDLKGKTPVMVSDTATGSHTIRLRLSGYAEWESTVQAPQGGTKTVSATLDPTDTELSQGIFISSNPSGAKVILDSLEKGITPLTLNSIAPGIHILELEHPGYNSWKSTIDVPETQLKVISVNLTPRPDNMPGWIRVSSNPANASVIVDGTFRGRTPENSSLNIDAVIPGEHTVVLALSGYRSYSTPAIVSPNLVSLINTTLIPVSGPLAKGVLSVTTDPAGATVILDNESVGISPLTAGDITAGDHRVTIQMKGYKDYSTSILVSAGATRTVSATLLPVTSSLHSPAFPLTALIALGIIFFIALKKKY